MKKTALPKTYNPKSVEKKLYHAWEKSGYFNPDKLPGQRTKRFSVAMPPPNVTGDLHIGHAQTITIEDVLVRYHRMKGEAALWVPGVDHAGIATQVKVERRLAELGLSRHAIGREKFLKHVWTWKKKYGDIITGQIRGLGASCDWSREHFTMDPNLTEAVHEAFIRLYRQGLIYRGERVIHWCPKDQTGLSDLEVVYEEVPAKLYHICYGLIQVATQRPETMLGDTAVAVNPKDKRYKHLVGKRVIVPLTGREVPVIADSAIDMNFGTGAVKVTPAHDPMDWEIGQRHHLPMIQVIGSDGRLTAAAGEFAGLDVMAARQRVIEELRSEGLLTKEEDYITKIPLCSRCHTVIEPLVSKQWFLNVQGMAKEALRAVRSGRIRFVPDRFTKVFVRWMENIHDWNISRQLWWGHRIPVWVRETPQSSGKKNSPALETMVCCDRPAGRGWRQEDDTLDTWFSSGLWTFSTLGWPKKTHDLARFHPTDVMETGWDILFFWVARMIMMSLEFTGEVPFRTVYLHGLILDKDGKKMSKSKGTGIDPLIMTGKYGTDALRLSLLIGQSAGQDFRLIEDRVAHFRNFVNKLWNVTRYIQSQKTISHKLKPISSTIADRWITARLDWLTRETTRHLDHLEFSLAGEKLVAFLWHDLADWYVEINKFEKNTALLRQVLEQYLRLLHPFAPFITERLWQTLEPRRAKEFLMVAPWPRSKKPAEPAEFARWQATIRALRSFRLHSGLTRQDQAHVCPNTKNPPQDYLNNLTGLAFKADPVTGEKIRLGYSTFIFPAERVVAHASWRNKERDSLAAYIGAKQQALKNKRLPDTVRQQFDYQLAEAQNRLREL